MYISEISERTGLSIHTLRYYEKEGLLTNISRNESGRRVYSETDLAWLAWIQRLKSTGMSLEGIKRFSVLRSMGDSSISDRKNMLIEHAQVLKNDIQHLKDELEIVEYKIAAYQEKENKLLT
ncbi:MerR family transcriptional regulator [Litoribrevibacter euphylliae]|uniref:MerR family transcriptional regulator n=1 Tax=Litoribrevibacter euphylliae TaxID=1834034 RepID=A0ABV7HFF2_9GAMM